MHNRGKMYVAYMLKWKVALRPIVFATRQKKVLQLYLVSPVLKPALKHKVEMTGKQLCFCPVFLPTEA